MLTKKLWVVAVLAIAVTACQKESITPDETNEPTGQLQLEFDHRFNEQALVFNTPFLSRTGDSLSISMLKYYISNIALQRADGSWWTQDESYYLVDAQLMASTLLQINQIPPGEYTHLRYTVGVDSLRNVSGAQTGALVPSNGMFWSWNSGYIFFKLEGNSPQAAGPVQFHIGGYSGVYAAQQSIVSMLHEPLLIQPQANPQLHTVVAVDKLLDGQQTIQLNQLHQVHMPGPNAKLLSENIASMFSLHHVHH